MSTQRFDGWNRVPPNLVLKSQLAEMDMPRRPDGPIRGWIDTRNAIGRRDSFALYDIAESAPTGGSARQLDQAAARRIDRHYVCEDCQANTEQHLGWHDPCHRGGVPEPTEPCPMLARRCTACRHLAELRAVQRHAAVQRTAAVEWARSLVDRDATVLVRITALLPDPALTVSGRRRPVIGHRLDVFTSYGCGDRVMIPRNTTAIDDRPLRDRDVICWNPTEATLLRRILRIDPDDRAVRPEPDVNMSAHVDFATAFKTTSPRSISGLLQARATAWRALIDPTTATLMPSTDPGPADRCLLLLRRMAGQPDGSFPASPY